MQSLVGAQPAVMASKGGQSAHQESVRHLQLLRSQVPELGSEVPGCLNSHCRQQKEPKGVCPISVRPIS